MEKKKVLKLNLPIEMVEEILLNLPVKSLLRFSSVSKTWNSIIWRSWFVKRYRRHAALPGRERIVLPSGNPFDFSLGKSLQTYDVSSISSSMSSGSGTVVCEFADRPILLCLCNELWLVGSLGCPDMNERELKNQFYLWNPSMRKHKKLPYPSVVLPSPFVVRGSFLYIYSFTYGLGYDAAGDDYKILKIPKINQAFAIGDCKAELYSLRSDSWREIPNFSEDIEPRDMPVVFVSGNLHWLPYLYPARRVIISFDLSTEKFGEVNYPHTIEENKALSIDVLRGMLCVTVNADKKCFIWVMEDYGVARSWNLKFTIKHSNYSIFNFRPLHLYEDGAILARALKRGMRRGRTCRVFIHQDEKTGLQELSNGSHVNESEDIFDGILYVDSLVAPAIWSALV